MKKKLLVVSLLLACGLVGSTLTSCGPSEEPPVTDDPNDEKPDDQQPDDENPDDENPDDETPSEPETVQTVAISGPRSLKEGESASFSVSVYGGKNKSVTWTSSDPSVATIDENGNVKAIKEGTTKIQATSKEDPTKKSDEWELIVEGVRATEVSIVLELDDNENKEDFKYNAETDVWDIPGGQEFMVSCEFGEGVSSIPDSISYSFAFNDGSQATVDDYTIEMEYDENNKATGRAKVRFNSVFTGGVLIVNASYSSSMERLEKGQLSVNSYDKNADNDAKVQEIIEKIKTKENQGLVNATRVVEKNDHTITTNFESFDGVTYAHTVDVADEEASQSEEYTYMTADKDHNQTYMFSYDNSDKSVLDMYVNSSFIDENESREVTNASIPHFIIDGAPTYGFSSILSKIATSNPYEENIAFGDFLARGNATYEFSQSEEGISKVEVESRFTDDLDIDNWLEFSFDYDSTTFELKGYEFSLREKDEKGMYQVVYGESGSNFVYEETKPQESEKKINIADYYITGLSVEYSDNYLDIIGADESLADRFSATLDGEKYVAEYDATIPFVFDKINPETGSTKIDVPTITVENSKTGKRSVSTTEMEAEIENGTETEFVSGCFFTVSAPKDKDGNMYIGEETITVSTKGGATDTVTIEWIEPKVNGIKFDYPSDTTVNETHVFPEIRQYRETDYFWLNTDNDDTTFRFGFEMVEGNENGLTLRYNEGDEDKGNPSGSYSIIGNEVGTYKFKFKVKSRIERVFNEETNQYEDHEVPYEGDPIVTEETYTLTVTEPISADEVYENIVGKTYEYNSSTSSYTLEITSESKMKLTMPTVDIREEGSEVTETKNVTVDIDYEIDKEGKLRAIPDRAATGEELNAIQVFDSDHSYFESISDEEILINESYSEISLPLRLRSDAGFDPTNYNYNYVTFSLPVELDGFAGNSYKGEAFLSGVMSMSTAIVEFTDESNGEVTVTKNSDGAKILEVGFTYSIINEGTEYETYNFVILDNATGTEAEKLTIKSMTLSYDKASLSINFEYPGEYASFTSTISVDMTNPL